MSLKYDPCFIMADLAKEWIGFMGINGSKVRWKDLTVCHSDFTEMIFILKVSIKFTLWPFSETYFNKFPLVLYLLDRTRYIIR